MSTDAKDLRGLTGRLGSPRDVAATAAVAYRHGRFSGRHPVLMFVVLPPFALLLSWAAVLTVCLLVASALGLGSGGANVDGPFSQWLAGNMMRSRSRFSSSRRPAQPCSCVTWPLGPA